VVVVAVLEVAVVLVEVVGVLAAMVVPSVDESSDVDDSFACVAKIRVSKIIPSVVAAFSVVVIAAVSVANR